MQIWCQVLNVLMAYVLSMIRRLTNESSDFSTVFYLNSMRFWIRECFPISRSTLWLTKKYHLSALTPVEIIIELGLEEMLEYSLQIFPARPIQRAWSWS